MHKWLQKLSACVCWSCTINNIWIQWQIFCQQSLSVHMTAVTIAFNCFFGKINYAHKLFQIHQWNRTLSNQSTTLLHWKGMYSVYDLIYVHQSTCYFCNTLKKESLLLYNSMASDEHTIFSGRGTCLLE